MHNPSHMAAARDCDWLEDEPADWVDMAKMANIDDQKPGFAIEELPDKDNEIEKHEGKLQDMDDETCAVSSLTMTLDSMVGHVGPLSGSVTICSVDVPDMKTEDSLNAPSTEIGAHWVWKKAVYLDDEMWYREEHDEMKNLESGSAGCEFEDVSALRRNRLCEGKHSKLKKEVSRVFTRHEPGIMTSPQSRTMIGKCEPNEQQSNQVWMRLNGKTRPMDVWAGRKKEVERKAREMF